MRFARLSRSRPDDVPAQHIAALIETATTARTSMTAVFRNDLGRTFVQCESGVEDFVRHLRSARRAQDGAEHLHAGPDILHRLSKKEQQETGKVWRWEGSACPFHAGERAEMAAALRLGVTVWDFGVTAEITVPAPEQILGGPDGPDVSTS